MPVACDGESLLEFCRAKAATGWRTEAHAAFDFRLFRNIGERPFTGPTADQCTASLIWDARYKYVHFTALQPLFFDLERLANTRIGPGGVVELRPPRRPRGAAERA